MRQPSATIEHRRERVGGLRTAWVERHADVATSRVPLVLVPGLSMSWQAYRWVLDALPTDRDVMVVDPPGAGRSARLRGGMSAGAQARHLAAWLDHLQLPGLDLVGHSLGALTAARLAAARPELVRAVTLVSPSPDPRMPRLREHVGALAAGVPQEAPRVLVQAAYDYVRSSPRVVAGFRREIGTTADEVMEGVRATVLVVRGSEDRVSSERWCGDLAEAGGGRLVTVPDGAHGLPQQHPRELVALLDDRSTDRHG
ncbi:alpha/beta hydrolase [Janibacter sp. YIM B02568]|uniref:alpha/beta fold hydrolase n=1 Tax=Janibacter endophyticus TaxID=2806261 RepID=UPI00194F2A59|nr:alpha/beta hydrolase [Janibacter endophyticus]MBM6546371.1 alpha/beta hydrolase [Janibacter endophyticus]